MPKEKYEHFMDDYAQSANTLFHFMTRKDYLEDILLNKAIIPRYCKENIEYLKIKNGDMPFSEVLVLQKCFCDIPFHKLTESFSVKAVGENYEQLEDRDKEKVPNKFTHPELYGEYAIAFSKRWGEKHNLQPIHYLNEISQYTRELSNLINQILNSDNVPEVYSDDVLNRLCFSKPLRGSMKRKFKCGDGRDIEIEYQKNFHDEQEWRYVPSNDAVASVKIDTVIANPYLLKMNGEEMDVSRELKEERYSSLWIKYSYDDVRYLIVPNVLARVELIKTIMSIPENMFNKNVDVEMQKYILISKILVLDEIRKDW